MRSGLGSRGQVEALSLHILERLDYPRFMYDSYAILNLDVVGVLSLVGARLIMNKKYEMKLEQC